MVQIQNRPTENAHTFLCRIIPRWEPGATAALRRTPEPKALSLWSQDCAPTHPLRTSAIANALARAGL